MMRLLKWILLTVITILLGATPAFSAPPTSVSTYHCISLYWTPANNEGGQPVSVQYRVTGETAWRPALAMNYNPVSSTEVKGDYRGSIVNLRPDTSYDISLQVGTSGESALLTARTASEDVPIATAISVGNRTTTVTIDQSGTPEGYLLFDGTGSTIDLNNAQDQGILVKGSYIILHGFTIRNARQHGINIQSGHHIIIEDCDISKWGEARPDGFGKNTQSGVFSDNPQLYGVTIQRCKIHHPNYDTNRWDEPVLDTHPEGPQGISFLNSAGNHVIRYNEIWSDADHYFNDGIGYGANASYRGFPGADSDIYGNYFANTHDDGIEAEGGNQNVRIWNNFIEATYIGIGNAATSVGPLYMWRNVIGSNERYAVKMGFSTNLSWMTGETFLFNNTILNSSGGLGTSTAMVRAIRYCTTRNNILHVRSSSVFSISTSTDNLDNDFDLDLLSAGFPDGSESHGIVGTPTYLHSTLFDGATKTGDFQLAASSWGYDHGMVIPNFCELYAGASPDMGAQEAGAPAMVFGVNAFFNPPLLNEVPSVTAFPATQNVLLSQSASLWGTADWIPTGAITVAWSKVSGPGSVTFSDANALNTTATFSTLGTYVLRFEASDSSYVASMDVTVIAKENSAPTAMQTPLAKTVALEAPATLTGTASDDGLPGMMYVAWTKVSGPGTVTFSDSDLPITKATFSAVGTYVIKFRAYDSLLYGARNSTITVQNNAQPTVSVVVPTSPTPTAGVPLTLTGSATDDGLPQPLTYSWTPTSSNPGTVTFSNPTEKITTATFSVAGTYMIKFKASDSLLYGAKNITVVVH